MKFPEKNSKGECLCQRCCKKRGGNAPIISFAELTDPENFRYACERCGNKRCPHHEWHNFVCTNSNEPGQVGRFCN